MGHASVGNIAQFWLRRLYAKGKLTIKDCVDAMVKAGEQLAASEGYYSDDYMLEMGLTEVINHLVSHQPVTWVKNRLIHGAVEPVVEDMTKRQKEIFAEWMDGDKVGDWDGDVDNEESQYAIFASIPWRFAPGWRGRYMRDEIKYLTHFTN